jgi:hypothetical protein
MAVAFFGREDFRFEMYFAHPEEDSTLNLLQTV